MFCLWTGCEGVGEKVMRGELLVFVSNVRVCILASSCLASNTGANICLLSDYLVSLSPWGEPLKTVCFLIALWAWSNIFYIRFFKFCISYKRVTRPLQYTIKCLIKFFFRQWLIIIVVSGGKFVFLQSHVQVLSSEP